METFYLQTVYYIDKSKNALNEAMYLSARAGHRDLVDFFIQQAADDWNLGMYSAAEGGHRDLVELFIQQGADNWNRDGAELGRHWALADFFYGKKT